MVTEPGHDTPAEIILSGFKIRGAYSAMMAKKSYAVKLKDTDGETSYDHSFFDLRSDNDWILDAMYIDPARMRNRVSTDLWNDFSMRPYYAEEEPGMINGTRGVFVEVFLNDSYNGFYCMTEKVDRKQLNLKKYNTTGDLTTVTQHGGLYKAFDWTIGTLLGNKYMNGGVIPGYGNNSESWSGFEVKYPDIELES